MKTRYSKKDLLKLLKQIDARNPLLDNYDNQEFDEWDWRAIRAYVALVAAEKGK